MNNCIFCAIVAHQTPAYVVYEDDHVVAFLDREPLVRGHTLVIPKKHFETMFDMSGDVLEQVMRSTKHVAENLKIKLGAAGMNMLHASGTVAQQSVPHFHIHLAPRFPNDGLDLWPRVSYHKADLERVYEDLTR
jgi:histidine triad (HIT) family protein